MEDRDNQLLAGTGASEAREAAMTDAALMVVGIGAVAIALVVNIAALVGWLRRRWR